jgi:glutamate-ammonia-ligase adenylyltransferase
MQLGEQFIAQAHAFTYHRPLTPDEVTQIAHTRQRKEAQATRPVTTRRRRKSRTQNVKAGYGGLVDIEFAVQILQLIHGTDSLQVRVQHTVGAITQLHEIAALTNDQKAQLLEAYEFLRRVENSLRIVHDRPLDALPNKAAELEKLARRLGYVDQNGEVSSRFLKDYQDCTQRTRALFHELLGIHN